MQAVSYYYLQANNHNQTTCTRATIMAPQLPWMVFKLGAKCTVNASVWKALAQAVNDARASHRVWVVVSGFSRVSNAEQ